MPSHFLNQCWLIVLRTFWTYFMKVYDISHLLPIGDMWWLVAFWMPCHFMNLCRHIVQWTFWTNSMNVYGMSHLLPMCDIARVCIEVYCLFKLVKIDTCDGLSPNQWRAITWTTADLFFIETFLNKLRLYFAVTITIVICYIQKDIIKRKPYCSASVRGSHWSGGISSQRSAVCLPRC